MIDTKKIMEILSSEEIDALLRLHWNGEVTGMAVKAWEKLKNESII